MSLGVPLPELPDGLHEPLRRLLAATRTLSAGREDGRVTTHQVIRSVWKTDPSRSPLELYAYLLRLAQDFVARYPLFETQGNFGSIDGDPPAGMRYNAVSPSRWSAEGLPFPNLLANGGFAHSGEIETDAPEGTQADPEFLEPLVSYRPTGRFKGGVVRSFLPPHNLKEVSAALLRLLDHPETSMQELTQVLRGPDFPTGGILANPKDLDRIYRSGEGELIVRARTTLQKGSKGEARITLSELPYGKTKTEVLEALSVLARENRVSGIVDVLELSTRERLRIEIVLKQDQPPRALIDFLQRSNVFENHIEVWMHVTKDGQEMRVNLLDLLRSHLDWARRHAGSERRLRADLKTLAEQSDPRRTEIADL